MNQQQQQQQQQPNSNLSSNSSSNSASSPLTKEEKDLIRDLSSKYKELKEKNPAFDSKSFITHELTTRCGPQRAREIMDYMQKMSKSKVAQANQAVQHSQMSAVPAPQQLQQQQHFSNFQQTNQLSRGPQTSQIPNSGLFLNNANSFHPNVSVPRQQHIPNQMYTQMKNQSGQQTMLPSQQQQLLQQQHHQQQQQQQYHSQSGMNVFTSNKDPIIKREGQQNNNQNDLGLDAAPKLEDLQADLTTIAEKHIQLNILSEKEINVESDAADGSLRKSLAEEDKSTIPGVGVIARPNMTIDNPAPRSLALQTNVLDEVGINSAVANLGKPQIQITNEAAILLSEGIQMHLSQLIDAAIVHSRKRTNRTATEHFHKTLGLIEKEAPYSGRGEIFPENRGNLGMLWGPPRMEELEEYTLRVNDQYNEKRIRLVENLVEEMKNDDDKRLQKKKGQGAPNTDIPKDAWWLRDDKYRESGGASLEDLAMMRFKYDVAKKYELGPFNTRKKPKKDDEDEEVSTVEVFTPSFRPNPVIRYENIPLTKSTWTRQPCPLLEREKNGSLTLTQSDIISAISKNRGNDLGSTRGNIDFGTSLRIAKSSVLQRR